MKGFQDEAIYFKQSISFKRETNISIFIALIKPLKEGGYSFITKSSRSLEIYNKKRES